MLGQSSRLYYHWFESWAGENIKLLLSLLALDYSGKVVASSVFPSLAGGGGCGIFIQLTN